jgi:acyl-CoA reductase-like NAD-dependent aldehyde dehydrogenase
MTVAEIRSYIGGHARIGSATFTRNLGSAFRFVDDFDVGALWINEASRFRLDLYPFGGVKQSGVGREGIRYAIDEMSQIKFIGMRP